MDKTEKARTGGVTAGSPWSHSNHMGVRYAWLSVRAFRGVLTGQTGLRVIRRIP